MFKTSKGDHRYLHYLLYKYRSKLSGLLLSWARTLGH